MEKEIKSDKIKENIRKLKEKTRVFLKNKYNLVFVLVLICAFAIRLYYFSLTKHQTLWWDEAEYFSKAKSIVLGTPFWIAPIREMIVPYFWSILYFLSPGETLARFFQVIVSTITVLFTYIIANKLFDKKIALISSIFMSVFSIHLFFTSRLLVYIWAPMIYVLAIYFFLKRDEKNIYLYISAAIISLGVVAYFSSSFLLIFLLIFLLTIEKKDFFKKKSNYLALLIFILVMLPFVTYYMIKIGVPLPRFTQVSQSLSHASEGKILPFANWFDYFYMLPRLLLFPLLYIFAFGSFLLLSKLFLGFDLILKKQSEALKNYYFIMLWTFFTLSIYSFIYVIGGDVVYDGFILPAFPAIFIICSITLVWIYDSIKKYEKTIALIVILLLIGFAVYAQVKNTDTMIKGKLTSFDEIKEAGEYLKEVSPKNAIIYSQALPVLTYYSERKVISIPSNQSDFENNLSIINPDYMLLTIYERSPDWAYEWPIKNQDKLKIDRTYFYSKNQVSTQIYSFNKNSINLSNLNSLN